VFVSVFLVVVASSSALADSKRGQAQFRLCSSCHGAEGQGKISIEAPAIAGMQVWYIESQLKKYQEGARGKHPKDWAAMRMRPMAKTLQRPDDIANVAEYVSRLPRSELTETVRGDWVKGKERFDGICVACHGADGKGMEILQAPSLLGQSDWYLLKQLRHFKEKVRGFDPQLDPTGAQMVGIAGMLDDQAMKDVVSYISVLNGYEVGTK
jgi:cytochrome c oxidase subunit 2